MHAQVILLANLHSLTFWTLLPLQSSRLRTAGNRKKSSTFKRIIFVSRQVRFQKTKFKTDAINYELTFESNPGLLTFAGAHLYNESHFFCVSRDDCATSSVTESFLFLFTSASMMLKNYCNPNKISLNDLKSCRENTSSSEELRSLVTH